MRQLASGGMMGYVQSQAARHIEANGITVTLSGGGGTAKALVDRDPERLARELPLSLEGRVTGDAALFSFAPGTAVKEGDLITCGVQQFTMHPPREVAAADLTMAVVFFGTAGGIR